MTGKVSVVIEQDEQGCYAWCPELRGCQSQGRTVEETLVNIREAIELFLESLTYEERSAALSQEILTTAVAYSAGDLGLSHAPRLRRLPESRLPGDSRSRGLPDRG